MRTSVTLMTGQEFDEDIENDRYLIGIFDFGVRVWDNELERGTIFPWHMVRRVDEEEWDRDEV